MIIAPAVRLSFCVASLISVAHAAEFRSAQDKVAVLYDAPSTQAGKRFIVCAGHPLEVLVKLDRWTKVRDADGDISWVEAKSLSDRRMLVVTSSGTEIRDKPGADGAPVFRAGNGLLLELTDTPIDGWAKVHHRDGQSGYVSSKDVWGL